MPFKITLFTDSLVLTSGESITKKMAIIYTIHGSAVYIHRIVAVSVISG
ncbi:hypothetical protein [Viscerimonas tarda]